MKLDRDISKFNFSSELAFLASHDSQMLDLFDVGNESPHQTLELMGRKTDHHGLYDDYSVHALVDRPLPTDKLSVFDGQYAGFDYLTVSVRAYVREDTAPPPVTDPALSDGNGNTLALSNGEALYYVGSALVA